MGYIPGVPEHLQSAAAALLDDEALRKVGSALGSAGFDVAVVGGSVLDLFRGCENRDLDVASAAPVDVATGLLSKVGHVIPTGEDFGTVTVVVPTSGGDVPVEVTTFRAEQYLDPGSRNPTVTIVDDIVEDLARRDFTVNAMALRLHDAPAGPGLVDPFGGADDLAAGVLRAVGDARARFDEDPLRIVRFVRIGATKDLDPDPATQHAAADMVDRLKVIAVERIAAELVKLVDFASTPRFVEAVNLARGTGVDRFLFGTTVPVDAAVNVTFPAARLAGVLMHTPDPGRVLRQLRVTNNRARDVLSVLDGVSTVTDRVRVREFVADSSDDVVDATVELATVTGADVTELVAAAADRDRLRTFPLRGGMLLEEARVRGVRLEGPQIGAALKAARIRFLRDPDTGMDELLEAAFS